MKAIESAILVNVIASFATSLHRAKSFWSREVTPHQTTSRYSGNGGESVTVPDGLKEIFARQYAAHKDAKKLVSEKMKLVREYAAILNAAILMAGEAGESVKAVHAELAQVEESRLAAAKAAADARDAAAAALLEKAKAGK